MPRKRLFRGMMCAISTCLGANANVFLFALIPFATEYFVLFAVSIYYIAQVVFCYLWFLMCLTSYAPMVTVKKLTVSQYLYTIPALLEIIIITFINPYIGIVCTITKDGSYVRTPAGFYWNLIFPGIYLIAAYALLVCAIFSKKERHALQRNILIMFLSFLPLGATIIQCCVQDATISIIWPIATLSLLVLYQIDSFYFIEKKRSMQAELKAQVAKNKIAVMRSQIQPHFLYNTLTVIRALIEKDPQKAQEVITDFSSYLRLNMDSMTQESPVYIDKEINHTRLYSSIEMLRFPDMEIIFDIQDSNFKVPSLSVQPMVENAIKHGIRERREIKGGKVTVSTYREGNNHVVRIADNGPGFNDNGPKDTSRSHIGLSNTQKRIEEMMHGKFIIDSKDGEGTTIYFIIPEE